LSEYALKKSIKDIFKIQLNLTSIELSDRIFHFFFFEKSVIKVNYEKIQNLSSEPLYYSMNGLFEIFHLYLSQKLFITSYDIQISEQKHGRIFIQNVVMELRYYHNNWLLFYYHFWVLLYNICKPKTFVQNKIESFIINSKNKTFEYFTWILYAKVSGNFF
jgi:hypothetical protein